MAPPASAASPSAHHSVTYRWRCVGGAAFSKRALKPSSRACGWANDPSCTAVDSAPCLAVACATEHVVTDVDGVAEWDKETSYDNLAVAVGDTLIFNYADNHGKCLLRVDYRCGSTYFTTRMSLACSHGAKHTATPN